MLEIELMMRGKKTDGGGGFRHPYIFRDVSIIMLPPQASGSHLRLCVMEWISCVLNFDCRSDVTPVNALSQLPLYNGPRPPQTLSIPLDRVLSQTRVGLPTSRNQPNLTRQFNNCIVIPKPYSSKIPQVTLITGSPPRGAKPDQ